jgi:hypothetical protein
MKTAEKSTFRKCTNFVAIYQRRPNDTRRFILFPKLIIFFFTEIIYIYIRKNSKICLLNQAEKISFRSVHKFPPANIGDSVRVTLPDDDRGRADPRNIIFAVVSIEDEQYYKLGNKYGTSPHLYTRNQFGICLLPLIPLDEMVHKEITLREITSLTSDGGGQGYKGCSCKEKCDTYRCKCKSSSILCNSKCHGNMPCNNKG